MKRTVCGILAGTALCLGLGGCLQKKESAEVLEAPAQLSQTVSDTGSDAELAAFLAELARDRALYLEALETRLSAWETKQDNTVPEQNYRFEKKNGGVIVTEYVGTDSEVTVPAMLDGLPVLTIGENAFRGKKVVSVVIPEGVRTLDWFAFYGCNELKSITLPASLTMVEYGAFDGCNSTLTVQCPIGSYAATYAISCGMRTEQS